MKKDCGYPHATFGPEGACCQNHLDQFNVISSDYFGSTNSEAQDFFYKHGISLNRFQDILQHIDEHVKQGRKICFFLTPLPPAYPKETL